MNARTQDFLCPDQLTARLAGTGHRCRVEVVDQTGSTNSDLVNACRETATALPWLKVARHQSAGRGRLGRAWLAEPGQALLFSLAQPIATTPAQVPAVTLVCGIALASVCRAHQVPAAIKWPNDLWIGERKLAGILCEMSTDAHGQRSLVIGVGLNLALDAHARSALPNAAALDEFDPDAATPAGRLAWISELASALLSACADFETRGFAPWRARWPALDAMARKAVVVRQGESEVLRGEAQGIDEFGRLRVADEHGHVVMVHSGEVSLRPA